MKPKISIFGLGYVGVVSLGCLYSEGYEVIGVDIDSTKVESIKKGISPIIEKGMQELIAEAAKSGLTEFTNDVAYAILNSDISLVCVGTPAISNGDQDITAIKRVAEQIGEAMRHKSDYHVIVIRSTVIPGTVEEIIKPMLEQNSDKKSGKDFSLCFQPEFLREGSSIKDFKNPPFTVVGHNSGNSIGMVRQVFGNLPCDFIATSIRTAEMVKYCCNVFHALKITFANEIGRMCQAINVNSNEVMDLLCRDTQLNISPAYLRPGFAFGGSCLPKDLKALLYLAKMKDVVLPTISHILPSNRIHIDHAIDMVLRTNKKSVGMLGLSFKSGTDDLRASPLIIMAEQLIGKGINLKIYDPEVYISRLIGANRRYIEATIPHIASLMVDKCEDVIEGSPVIILGLPDKEIVEKLYQNCKKDQIVFDLVGIVDTSKIPGDYSGVCW